MSTLPDVYMVDYARHTSLYMSMKKNIYNISPVIKAWKTIEDQQTGWKRFLYGFYLIYISISRKEKSFSKSALGNYLKMSKIQNGRAKCGISHSWPELTL
jgi:hypothetical protein